MAVVLSASAEFSKLELHSCDPQFCTLASSQAYADKNRYNDVLAPDASLVRVPSVDYINANYVNIGMQKRVIACQAPIANTVADFWAMIYHSSSDCILMLTRLVEKDKPKSEEYWPKVGYWARYGSVMVLNRRCFFACDESNIIISELLVNDRKVYHVHYLDWNDNAAADPDDVILLIGLLIFFGLNNAIIHCSAGLGRGGVICAILRGIYSDEDPIKAVKSVRRDRHGCVQTKAQFRLVREVLEHLV